MFFQCEQFARLGARALRLSTHEQAESRRDSHARVGVAS